MFNLPIYKDLPAYSKSPITPGAIRSASERHQTMRLSRQEVLDAQKQLLLATISETTKLLQESNSKKWKQFFDKVAEDRVELEKADARRRSR